MFAYGDVRGLHDVQLLQKLLTARRSVQHLPVMLNRRCEGKRHNSRCRDYGRGRPCRNNRLSGEPERTRIGTMDPL